MLNYSIKKIKIAYWILFCWINSNGYYGSNGFLIRSMVEKKTSIEVWESVKLPILSLFRSWYVDILSLPPAPSACCCVVGICLTPTCGAISDIIITVARISNTGRYVDYTSSGRWIGFWGFYLRTITKVTNYLYTIKNF